MFTFPLLILLARTHLQVTALERGSFTFDKIEFEDPPKVNWNGVDQPAMPGKAIKITFHGVSEQASPMVVQGAPRKNFRDYFGIQGFDTIPEPGANTFTVWLPGDYPSSLTRLKLTVHDEYDDKAKDSVWLVTGIPSKTTKLPSIHPTASLGSTTISATAEFNRIDDLIAQLTASRGVDGPNWYWECRASSPFSPILPGGDNSKFQEQQWFPKVDSSFVVDPSYRYCQLLDRLVVDGSLSHFLSKTEVINISGVKVVANKNGQMGIGAVRFATPDGFKGTIKNNPNEPNEPNYGHPVEKTLRFSIYLDPKTLNAGLEPILSKLDKTSPDKIDVYANATVVPGKGLVGESGDDGIDTAHGKLFDIVQGIPMTFPADRATPTIDLHLKITRRIEDRRLPFHLIPPVSKKSQERGRY